LGIVNFHSSGEQLACKRPNVSPLFDSGLIDCIRLGCQFRLVNLQVEALKALDASHEFAL